MPLRHVLEGVVWKSAWFAARARRMAAAATAAVGACASFAVFGLGLNLFAPPVSADPPGYRPPAQAAPITPVRTSPLDEPLRLLAEAAKSYEQVNDYTCTLVKQERIRGQLQPEHVIAMKFRKQPFSVSMHWQAPRRFANQHVVYVHGANNNQMRVRSSGLLGTIGYVSIAPNDPRALEHSRHTITEAGMGNLIRRCSREWAEERNRNRTRVSMGEYEFAGRRCIRLELAMTQRAPDVYCYRTVMYLDKQTKLPLRTELYDWPREGGPATGELMEVYSYLNLQFNVGLTDRDFNY